MPQHDRRPNPKVSEFENAQTMEVCQNCATLHAFGTPCPECGLTFQQYARRFEKFGRSE